MRSCRLRESREVEKATKGIRERASAHGAAVVRIKKRGALYYRQNKLELTYRSLGFQKSRVEISMPSAAASAAAIDRSGNHVVL